MYISICIKRAHNSGLTSRTDKLDLIIFFKILWLNTENKTNGSLITFIRNSKKIKLSGDSHYNVEYT